MATEVPPTPTLPRKGGGESMPPKSLGLALAVIAVAQLMVVLDTAIVNIALPSIQRALHFTPTGLEWVVNGYALAFGGWLLLGGAVGLLLGGLITNYFSWRWVLFVNVPIGIVLALAAPRVLAATDGRPGRLDLPGAVAVTAGVTLLVYGLNRAASSGWTNASTVGPIAAAFVLLATFLIIELRSAQPLMPLRIFASRNRSGAYAVRFAIGATLSGLLFFLTQFLH